MAKSQGVLIFDKDGGKTTVTVEPSIKGAISGALAGAAAGSVIPGFGTTICAIGGGLIGLICGPKD